MPSLRSHIVALVVRNWHRTAFTSPEGLHRWIRWARQRENHRPPRSLDGRFDITARTVAGSPVYEVRPRRVESRQRLLYLHGGAFVFQITSHHWNLIAELAERVGAVVTVPIYPIAPEHGFHEMFGMVLEVYRDMLRETAAADIIDGRRFGGRQHGGGADHDGGAERPALARPPRADLARPRHVAVQPRRVRGGQGSIRGWPSRAGSRRSASTPPASTARTGASARSTAISRCCRRRCC